MITVCGCGVYMYFCSRFAVLLAASAVVFSTKVMCSLPCTDDNFMGRTRSTSRRCRRTNRQCVVPDRNLVCVIHCPTVKSRSVCSLCNCTSCPTAVGQCLMVDRALQQLHFGLANVVGLEPLRSSCSNQVVVTKWSVMLSQPRRTTSKNSHSVFMTYFIL